MRLIGDVPILRAIGGLQLRRARGEMSVAYDDEDGEQFQLVIQRRRRLSVILQMRYTLHHNDP